MKGEKECILSGYPNVISYDCTKKIIKQMEENICKLKTGNTQGTGFFCKIPFPNENNKLPVLMTNNHIINEEILFKKNEKITLEIEVEKNQKIIKLDKRIKYTNKEYDITIIELKESDGIKNYLSLDEKIIDDISISKIDNKYYKFIDETLYILQYPDRKLSVSYGILKGIYENKKYDFNHNCCTKGGSSGSPILSSINNKVIGIHKEGFNNYLYNKGTFLNYPIKDFFQQNKISINDKKTHVMSNNKNLQIIKNMIKIKNPYKFTKEKKLKFNINNIIYNENIINKEKNLIDKYNLMKNNPKKLSDLLNNKQIKIQRNLNINNNNKLLKYDLNNNFYKNMINKIILNQRNYIINKNREKKIMDFINIYKTLIKKRFWNEFKEGIKKIKPSTIRYSINKNIISQSYLSSHCLKENKNNSYLYESLSNTGSLTVFPNSLDNDCLHSIISMINLNKSHDENN